ncbi:hypothetical protein ABPG74_000879 [Tetrahymena malaccensis]
MEEQIQYNHKDPLINHKSDSENDDRNIMLRNEQQNNSNYIININDDNQSQQIQQNYYVKYFLMITVLIFAIIYLPPWCIATITILILILEIGSCLIKKKSNWRQSRHETLEDWERMFGLDNFQEVNDIPYTKEDLDCVYKQKKIFWNPNKKNEEYKKKIAIDRLQKCEKAYQNILKYHNWN